jgi:hypothetical protein
MRSREFLPAAVMSMLLMGCDVQEARDPAMDPRTPPGIPEGAPGETSPTAAQAVELRPMQGSGISGRAIVTPGDTSVALTITLSGSEPRGSHAARIYAGSCEDPGALLAEIDPILAGTGGIASAERIVRQPPLMVMGGQAVLMVYRPNGVVAGPAAACGEIPQQAGIVPEPTSPITDPAVQPARPPVHPRDIPPS